MNGPELKDIHLPGGNLWWPPAPGWWLIPAIALLAWLLLPRLCRWWRQRSLRRQALQELERIRSDARRGLDDKASIAAVATLLRRTLISYCGRDGYAASGSADWGEQMNALVGAACFDDAQLQLLTRERYRRQGRYDLNALFDACQRWLKSLPRKVDHVAA